MLFCKSLQVGPAAGVEMLGFSALPPPPVLVPCFLLGAEQNPGMLFLELWRPLPAFQTEVSLLEEPRISIETEMPFLREPLLTYPLCISVGEITPWAVL